jgi:hypothetical protein
MPVPFFYPPVKGGDQGVAPFERFKLSAVNDESAIYPLRGAEHSVAHLVVEEGLENGGRARVLEELCYVDAPRRGVTRGEARALIPVRPDEVVVRKVAPVRKELLPEPVPDIVQGGSDMHWKRGRGRRASGRALPRLTGVEEGEH